VLGGIAGAAGGEAYMRWEENHSKAIQRRIISRVNGIEVVEDITARAQRRQEAAMGAK
jgi:hypothetical protein